MNDFPGKEVTDFHDFLTPFLSLFSVAVSDIPRLRAHKESEGAYRKLLLDWHLTGSTRYDLMSPESLILL